MLEKFLEVEVPDNKSEDKPYVRHLIQEENVIPKHPFRCLISGSSASGKTVLLINLLTKSEFYKDYFDKFIIVSPNIYNPQLENAIEDIEAAFGAANPNSSRCITMSDWNEGELQTIWNVNAKLVQEDGMLFSPKLLFVFDDCVDDKRITNSHFLQQLFFRGRHINASSIFTTQAYNSFPLRLRKNCTNLIIFGSANEKEVLALAKEFKHRKITEEEFIKLFDHVTKERYSFLHINNQVPEINEMYRRKFKEILFIKR